MSDFSRPVTSSLEVLKVHRVVVYLLDGSSLCVQFMSIHLVGSKIDADG